MVNWHPIPWSFPSSSCFLSFRVSNSNCKVFFFCFQCNYVFLFFLWFTNSCLQFYSHSRCHHLSSSRLAASCLLIAFLLSYFLWCSSLAPAAFPALSQTQAVFCALVPGMSALTFPVLPTPAVPGTLAIFAFGSREPVLVSSVPDCHVQNAHAAYLQILQTILFQLLCLLKLVPLITSGISKLSLWQIHHCQIKLF